MLCLFISKQEVPQCTAGHADRYACKDSVFDFRFSTCVFFAFLFCVSCSYWFVRLPVRLGFRLRPARGMINDGHVNRVGHATPHDATMHFVLSLARPLHFSLFLLTCLISHAHTHETWHARNVLGGRLQCRAWFSTDGTHSRSHSHDGVLRGNPSVS